MKYLMILILKGMEKNPYLEKKTTKSFCTKGGIHGKYQSIFERWKIDWEKIHSNSRIKTREHEVSYDFNLEKNDFSMKNNDQLVKDEELSDEKFTTNLTQELKLVG